MPSEAATDVITGGGPHRKGRAFFWRSVSNSPFPLLDASHKPHRGFSLLAVVQAGKM